MGTLLEVILLLVILASFYLAFMSWKTWRIYQVVLVECVFLATVTFSYLAARTLKTHQSWRTAEHSWHEALDKVELQNRELAEGKWEQSHVVTEGIEQLKAQLHQLVHDRGSVWFGAQPEKINATTGVCDVTVESPDPHEIAPKSVLFVFEQSNIEDGGRFLGEFKVTKAEPKSKSIEIEPNFPLTPSQTERLSKAKGTWALYATMPVDDAELFAGMDEAERKKLVPEASLKEFADKNRTLRDYEYFFHQNTLECDLITDSMQKTQGDLTRTLAAEEKAQQEIKYRAAEKTALASDLEKFRYERQAVTKYAQTLRERALALRGELKTRLTATFRTAAELRRLQLKAAAEIDRRSSDQAANDLPQPAAPSP